MDRRTVLTGVAALVVASSVDAAGNSSNNRVVSTLASLVEREYPDAPLAMQVATILRANAQGGRYRSADPEKLGELLTADLRSKTNDKHLAVHYDPKDAALRTSASAAPTYEPTPPAPRNPSPKAREIFAPQGYGISNVDLLPGNIGLLRIDNFVPLYDVVRQRIGQAMELLSDSWGLILDLRNNGGGTSDTPAFLLSYFFDRPPFLLNRMVWRHLPEERIETTRNIEGRTYGETRPLIVLTSGETFSAAEAVAYSLQSTKRGFIVGERTGGGANPGDFFNLGAGYVAFVPQGRAVDAVTGKNWEGTGVVPDLAAPRAEALSVAHRTVIERAMSSTTNQDSLQILKDGLNAIGRT